MQFNVDWCSCTISVEIGSANIKAISVTSSLRTQGRLRVSHLWFWVKCVMKDWRPFGGEAHSEAEVCSNTHSCLLAQQQNRIHFRGQQRWAYSGCVIIVNIWGRFSVWLDLQGHLPFKSVSARGQRQSLESKTAAPENRKVSSEVIYVLYCAWHFNQSIEEKHNGMV